MQKYLPLQIQISNLETDISKAHLWFEEAISGDPYVDIQKDVMLPLQHRAFYLYIDSIETTFNSTRTVHIASRGRAYKRLKSRWYYDCRSNEF